MTTTKNNREKNGNKSWGVKSTNATVTAAQQKQQLTRAQQQQQQEQQNATTNITVKTIPKQQQK